MHAAHNWLLVYTQIEVLRLLPLQDDQFRGYGPVQRMHVQFDGMAAKHVRRQPNGPRVPFPDLLLNYTRLLFQLVKIPVAAVANHSVIGPEGQEPLVVFGPVTFSWPVRC